MTFITDPLLLAGKFADKLPTSYDALEARCKELEISMSVFEQAIERLHKIKGIKKSVKGGVIYYEREVEKPVTDVHGWIRSNYPKMDETNNGSGIDVDFSYLFLTPEELDKYKAEVRGVSYIPKRRYINTRR